MDIIKAPGAKSNTYLVEVAGMEMGSKSIIPRYCMLDVRFTADDKGESLSIARGDQYMLVVPYDAIEKLVHKARKSNRKAGH